MTRSIINLTPHPITIRVGEKEVTLPPSGRVARVGTIESPTRFLILEGDLQVPLVKREWGEIQLPPPKELGVDDPSSVVLVVSSLVGEAIKVQGLPPEWRGTTVVAPDTGATAIRDREGRIVAVTRLVLYVGGGQDA